MDNVTHGLFGGLLAAATVSLVERRGVRVSRNFRKVATVVGVIAAELPDSDLIYAGQRLGMGSLGYLLHHRGHTHTVLFALLSAILLWLATLWISRDSRQQTLRGALLALAVAGTLSHLALDYTNNYGIHPFWPVVNTWYYGDAVFIVEPWLWIASIPALWLYHEGRITRGLLGLLLAIILIAAWFISMVARDIAIAFTLASAAWMVVMHASVPARRATYALLAWAAMETIFMTASSRARNDVRIAVADSYKDVSLTPLVGNPLCYTGIVVESDANTYRVTDATVAPFPNIRSANTCSAQQRGGTGSTTPSNRTSTSTIKWNGSWSRPVSELRDMVASSCEVAAAMEFIRVPVWQQRGKDSVQIGDARFGAAGSGFASVTASMQPTSCPRFVPGWTPPRSDVLH